MFINLFIIEPPATRKVGKHRRSMIQLPFCCWGKLVLHGRILRLSDPFSLPSDQYSMQIHKAAFNHIIAQTQHASMLSSLHPSSFAKAVPSPRPTQTLFGVLHNQFIQHTGKRKPRGFACNREEGTLSHAR